MNESNNHVNSRIPESSFNQIIMSGQSISDFIKEAVEEKLNSSNLNFINSKIKKLKEDIELLEHQRKILDQKQNQIKNIPEQELKWLNETNKLFENNPHIFEGRYNLYMNLFPKSYKITKQDFKKLLDEAQSQQKEKLLLKEMQ